MRRQAGLLRAAVCCSAVITNWYATQKLLKQWARR
jgi:hypothetical protein